MEPNYSLARQMAKKVLKDYKLTEVPTDLRKIFQSLGLNILNWMIPRISMEPF